MSLINEKRYDIYDYKPNGIDDIIDTLHKEQNNKSRIIQKSCPACKSQEYNFAFDKYSFHYVQCASCMSLYVQNRLNENDMQKYDDNLKSKLIDFRKNQTNEVLNKKLK